MQRWIFGDRFLAFGISCFVAASLLSVGAVSGSRALSRALEKESANTSEIFAPDKGKLKVLLDGQPIGTEEFEIAPGDKGWTAHGTTELKVPDNPGARVSATLVLQPNGAPVNYEWTAQTDKKNGAHIVFQNGVAKITLKMEGARPFQQDLTFSSPIIAVLDNNLYHHYAILARLYDWTKRGSQNFPVLIPQDLTPGTIAVEATGAQDVDGKSYEGLRVTTPDLEVLLYMDKNHRLMRLDVPSAKVSVVRE